MREGLCREKERLIGERISLSRVVDNCNRSLADPATVFETGSVRRDAAKLHSATRNADAFWGRKCHRTKMRRSRVVAVSLLRRSMRWFEQASTVVQKAHTGCWARD
jgi:hypothetical protein